MIRLTAKGVLVPLWAIMFSRAIDRQLSVPDESCQVRTQVASRQSMLGSTLPMAWSPNSPSRLYVVQGADAPPNWHGESGRLWQRGPNSPCLDTAHRMSSGALRAKETAVPVAPESVSSRAYQSVVVLASGSRWWIVPRSWLQIPSRPACPERDHQSRQPKRIGIWASPSHAGCP